MIFSNSMHPGFDLIIKSASLDSFEWDEDFLSAGGSHMNNFHIPDLHQLEMIVTDLLKKPAHDVKHKAGITVTAFDNKQSRKFCKSL
jgi:hypothetical protein